MKDLILKRAYALDALIGFDCTKMDELRRNLAFEFKEHPEITKDSAAKAIDHTILSFNAAEGDVLRICEEAARYGFAAVCINPVWVKVAAEFRKKGGAGFRIATVIDFPLGASTVEARVAEAEKAVADGADELDLVIGIGLLKSGKLRETYESMRTVAGVKCFLKVILETSALTDPEKVDAALLAFFAGAKMLKTSTGVNGKAAVDDVRLLRAVAGNSLGVKAAGGIRDKETLLAMMRAGADRIGCSSSVSIMENW